MHAWYYNKNRKLPRHLIGDVFIVLHRSIKQKYDIYRLRYKIRENK